MNIKRIKKKVLKKKREIKEKAKLLCLDVSFEEIKVKPNIQQLREIFEEKFGPLFDPYKLISFSDDDGREKISFPLSIVDKNITIHFYLDGANNIAITKGGRNNSTDTTFQIGPLYKESHQNYVNNFLGKLKKQLIKGFHNEKRAIQIASKFAVDENCKIFYSDRLDTNGVDFSLVDQDGNLFYFQVKSSNYRALKAKSEKNELDGIPINFIVVNKYKSNDQIYENIFSSLMNRKKEYLEKAI